MDIIELRGLTFYGYHGVLTEESTLGQRFVVDIQLRLSLLDAGRLDDLTRTVDYGQVAQTVRTIVEGPPFRLIEALADALATAILTEYGLVDRVDVRVEKPSAPVAAAPSGVISVSIGRDRAALGTLNRIAPGVRAGAETSAGGSVLAEQGIRALLDREPPLLDPLDEPDVQIQPNGVDLTLESVWSMAGAGAIGRTNDERVIPSREPIEPTADGWYDLAAGSYVIRLREVVALPLDVMAFGRPRSSLLRSGAALHTAVWDAGYQGRSEALLVVYAESGIRLARGARVLQLVFLRLESPTRAYAGTYQGENVPVS